MTAAAYNRTVTTIAGLATVTALATGCAAGAPSSPNAGSSPPSTVSTATTETTPAVALAVTDPSSGSSVMHGRTKIAGRSTPGATVREDGGSTTHVKQDGSWSLLATVHPGDQTLTFHAIQRGSLDASQTLDLTGTLSASEQAAKRAADEAQFKASTQSISYAQLIKDSSPYVGNHVVFHGQVLQIQQSGSDGNLLLSVTDDGSGFWTDNVWVDYHQAIQAVQGDLITVYGTVSGTKSYDTQIGGTTYVPQMNAKYVDDVGSGGAGGSGGSSGGTPNGAPPGTVTGKDAAGFNIGVHCSDDQSSSLPGCDDSPSYNPDGTRQQP